MYCTKYVKTGLPGTKCPKCHGSGEVVVQEKDQAPETVTCEGCHGRGFDVIVQTIDRNRCKSCDEDCDGKGFDEEKSFVIQTLKRMDPKRRR